MLADLGLLSRTQLQKLAQSQNPSSTTVSWMWNPEQQSAQAVAQDNDDSWEVRAFQEDTNQAMGTTWPPRSYMCTFCKREFKSAQALGGHMNVHRRDRARLHNQVQPNSNTSPSYGGANSPAIIFPTREFMANGGVCLLYTLPNPNPGSTNGVTEPPSTHLTMSQFQSNNLMPRFPMPIDFPVISGSINSFHNHSSNIEPSASINCDSYQVSNVSPTEELDLELRLGLNPTRL